MPLCVRIALCLATCLLASTSFAQQPTASSVPNLIRYGGTLKDAQGAAQADSAVGVTFAIYREQDGGAPLWMETQNVTPDAHGHYNVLLGITTVTGLPSDLFSQQEQRWLGVQVQGQPEQSRVLLVSVPYAFKAGEADKLAGHAAIEFVTTDSLQRAVQQQLQQQGGASTSPAKTTGNGKSTKAGSAPVTTDPATNFADTTTNQVVMVQQKGTGAGLSATAPGNSGVVGTSNASAPSGVIAGVEGVSSLDSSFGVYGLATSSSSTHPGIGAYGRSTSPNGVGLEGIATGTGGTIGLIAQATSTGGIGIDATETATSGPTIGMVARVYSPTGTAAYILNSASGKVTGSLISARTAAGVQFSVDGSGNGILAGSLTAANALAGGTAITGNDTASTSTNGSFGVAGFLQNDANGVAVYGENDVAKGGVAIFGYDRATSGTSVGLRGVSTNPGGAGGFFQNLSTQTGAKILVAGDSSGTQRLSVDTEGNVNVVIGTTTQVIGPLVPVNHARITQYLDQYMRYSLKLMWSFPFPDTNYTVTCTPQADSTEVFYYEISSLNTDSVVVAATIGDQLPVTATFHCIGVHD